MKLKDSFLFITFLCGPFNAIYISQYSVIFLQKTTSRDIHENDIIFCKKVQQKRGTLLQKTLISGTNYQPCAFIEAWTKACRNIGSWGLHLCQTPRFYFAVHSSFRGAKYASLHISLMYIKQVTVKVNFILMCLYQSTFALVTK